MTLYGISAAVLDFYIYFNLTEWATINAYLKVKVHYDYIFFPLEYAILLVTAEVGESAHDLLPSNFLQSKEYVLFCWCK